MIITSRQQLFITIDWQEYGPLDSSGQRLWRRERLACSGESYPQRLPCHNPACAAGGFEIGEKIAELLASGEQDAFNSLICRQATPQAGQTRCLHVITYSITCVRPFQRQRPLLERVM